MYGKLILIRHGQSVYNEENRFTGWKDVDLTQKGIDEAIASAHLLKNITIDTAYTSNLMRAQKTLNLILSELELNLPITKNEALNERDYGSLVSQNKFEEILQKNTVKTKFKYGEEVMIYLHQTVSL